MTELNAQHHQYWWDLFDSDSGNKSLDNIPLGKMVDRFDGL
jgi:hypothetical protein